MSRIRANTITNQNANGAPNFPDGITVTGIVTATTTSQNITGDLSVTGNIGVGGTLTYEDVTNIDSVGVITARSGIRIGATGANTLVQGTATGIGIGESSPLGKLHVKSADSGGSAHDGADELVVEGSGDSGISILSGASNNGRLNFGDSGDNNVGRLQYNHSDNYLAFYNTGTEKLRIGTAGQLGIAGANYGTSGQVLTSQGASSAVQWATPAAGGKILQVKQSVKTNTQSFSTGSSTLADSYFDISGLSVSLTPASGTKILVSYSVNVGGQSGYGQALVLFRDSTQIYLGDADGSRPRVSNFNMALNNEDVQVFSGMFLDTHGANGSTAVTYKLQMYVATPGWTSRVNRGQTSGNSRYYGRGASNITVMEVAA